MNRKVLPVVDTMRQEIDRLFLHYVGPIGEFLSEDIYESWVQNGVTGPGGLRQYIHGLAKQIPDRSRRKEFVESASTLIKLNIKR